MGEIRVRTYLAQYGTDLIDQGYTVVPIQSGKKAPGFDGWTKAQPTKRQVNEWLENGYKSAGVGILTKVTCAIDIDCLDEEAALEFERFCLENIGPAPVRIGRAPKRLLLYRTTQPFKKRTSDEYRDDWGDKQQIEILGDGQQFVAFAIHPDTHRPYEWIDGKSPLNIRASELTEVTSEQIDALLAEFSRYAKDQKWDLAKTARVRQSGAATAEDNPWVEDSAPIEISWDELRNKLMLIGGCDDYDTWYQVGMALHHQFDGEEEGFELWNDWSETADNYDRDSLERHWKSFAIEGKKRAPLTARYIIRLAKEWVERTALELGTKLRDMFLSAKDLTDWTKAQAATKAAEIDSLQRAAIAQVAKERRDAITGTKTSLIEVKRALAYVPKSAESAPSWLDGWVFDTSDDRFFHIDKKLACTKLGFDAMFDRRAMTKKDVLEGKGSPSHTASELALRLFDIPIVSGRRYMPGRDTVFHEPDGVFANTYPEHEIPEKPEKTLPRDKKAVEIVKGHIAHLLASEREQRMLMDWLAYVVQHPGKKVNYAILLQGVEGDGKSFFAELMRSVMGVSNVKMANADTVIKSPFTDWSYGQCLVAVEEVRIHGARGIDKWEAINRIKPMITNHVIEVHPKGRPAFNAINTSSYLLFSNFRDALPLDDNSRRYLILFSRWQRKEDIGRFKAEHPHYYERLYRSLDESAGALREWLLAHECSSEFNPAGDAPDTDARRVMIRKSKPEFIQVLDDLIAEDETVEASRMLVDVTGLADIMMARSVDWPGPKLLATLLERDGYEALGRIRLNTASVHFFYSKSPEAFQSYDAAGELRVDTAKVRDYVAARREVLDDEL